MWNWELFFGYCLGRRFLGSASVVAAFVDTDTLVLKRECNGRGWEAEEENGETLDAGGMGRMGERERNARVGCTAHKRRSAVAKA